MHHYQKKACNSNAKRFVIIHNILKTYYKLLLIVPCVAYSYRGRIFSHMRPSYERTVSDLYRSMNISQWV